MAKKRGKGSAGGKRSGSSYVNLGRSHLQVLGLGTDTKDVAPSVLLFFDTERYVFNVGEGFQRFCVEHRVKISKVDGLLLTRLTSETAGGLPGMFLSMSENTCGGLLAGRSAISLHGPRGLSQLMQCIRTFIDTRAVGVAVHEFGSRREASEAAGAAGDAAPKAAPPPATADATCPPTAGDELPPVVDTACVKITPVLLEAQTSSEPGSEEAADSDAAADGGASVGASEERPRKRARRDHRDPERLLPDGRICANTRMPTAAAYICSLPDQPGRFHPDKAAALGVRPGPLYGKLKQGLAVEGANGRTVYPHECTDPVVPGPVAVVVDCPSPAYLPSLLASKALRRLAHRPQGDAAGGKAPEKQVSCVVHLASASVVESAEYASWMAGFGPDTVHMLVNGGGAGPLRQAPILNSSAVLACKLNVLQPALFPLHSIFPLHNAEGKPAVSVDEKRVPGVNMLKYTLWPQPKAGLELEDVPEIQSCTDVQQRISDGVPGFDAAATAARERAAAADDAADVPQCIRDASRQELEVTFLGTGAAMPSKYRNVTSIFLDFFDRGCLLLDCGEGTYGQLLRRYGRAEAHRYIRELRAVWISHIHADHHAGLMRLLAVRRALLGSECAPLLVLAPRPMRRVLAAYRHLDSVAFQYLDTANTLSDDGLAGLKHPFCRWAGAEVLLAQLRASLRLTELESFRVDHCAHAYGVKLVSAGGWKLVFSGDTRPCAAVVEAAKGATMLIHEATFEDGLEEEARAKKHSMTGEAIQCAEEAGAFRTVLTHFSQRYPKIPVIEHVNDRVGIAFDLMSVNLKDLPGLPQYVEPVGLLFKEIEEAEEGADADESVPAA